MPWNPDQYLKFKALRDQPFYDLLNFIQVRPNLEVIDLGCGDGHLTVKLAEYLPQSKVLGVDNSSEMLAKAYPLAREGVQFDLQPIEAATGQYDIVFSNAAIQWVPDHANLIPRLFAMVKAGGQLVIQQPANHDSITHRTIRELAEIAPFKDHFTGNERQWVVQKAEVYGEWLHQVGGQNLTLIEKVYPHVLPDVDAVIEWVRGTALVPYMEPLSAELQALFLQHLREKLLAHFGAGEVFFGFRRMLLVADKPL